MATCLTNFGTDCRHQSTSNWIHTTELLWDWKYPQACPQSLKQTQWGKSILLSNLNRKKAISSSHARKERPYVVSKVKQGTGDRRGNIYSFWISVTKNTRRWKLKGSESLTNGSKMKLLQIACCNVQEKRGCIPKQQTEKWREMLYVLSICCKP